MNPFPDLQAFKVSIIDHVATVMITRPPVNAQNSAFRAEITRISDAFH